MGLLHSYAARAGSAPAPSPLLPSRALLPQLRKSSWTLRSTFNSTSSRETPSLPSEWYQGLGQWCPDYRLINLNPSLLSSRSNALASISKLPLSSFQPCTSQELQEALYTEISDQLLCPTHLQGAPLTLNTYYQRLPCSGTSLEIPPRWRSPPS